MWGYAFHRSVKNALIAGSAVGQKNRGRRLALVSTDATLNAVSKLLVARELPLAQAVAPYFSVRRL
jgi:hypothetical protein